MPVALNRLVLDYDQLHHLRPGVPARGRRLLRRQQVLLPRHRRARRSSTSRTGSARSSPTTAVIGTGYTPVRAVIDRAACADRPARSPARARRHARGRRRASTSARRSEAWRAAADAVGPDATSSTSTGRSRACCRSCRRCTTTCGRRRRACTSWSRSSPTAARSSSTRRTSPRSATRTAQLIDEIGYHCRDYFLTQWDRFRRYPGGVLAHSTHVKGLGTLRCRDRRRAPAHHG